MLSCGKMLIHLYAFWGSASGTNNRVLLHIIVHSWKIKMKTKDTY